MAYISSTSIKSRNELVVNMKGLSYEGERQMHFVLIWNDRDISFADSYNTSGDANVIFNISSVPSGNQSFTVKRIMEQTGNRFVVGTFSIDVGGGSQPSVHKLTYIKLIEFISVEDGYVKVKIQTDGYGDVDLVSVTKDWDLTGRYRNNKYVYIAHDYIEEEHITNGEFYGTVSYNFNATDLSYFPSVPAGTCHLASGGGLYDNNYSIFSKEFLCMSKYNSWTVYRRTYATTLTRDNNGFNANVVNLDTVKQDWNRLVNMSFYLEATTYGDIKYSQYASYIPQSGDIITADMYNSLLSAVQRCCNRVGMSSSDLPSFVSANQIISKYFISDIGVVVDRCLMAQRNNVNENVIRNQ